MADTTIGISKQTHDQLKDMKQRGEDMEDVITFVLSLKECPKCREGELKIKKSYLFEPLYFDLVCPVCGHEVERWRVPFEPKDGGEIK